MNVFLIGEDEALAQSIRKIMMRERVHCPLSSMISFDQAIRQFAGVGADLVVAVLPEDPIRAIEALETLASLPRHDGNLVIAIGPAADAKMVIRALRGAVDDYLDVDDLENELVAVLSCWRHRWTIDRPEGKLVAVLSPSGGSGSSTLAANLSVLAASHYKTVGLIDLKLETGDLATLLDLKSSHSLADLCKHIERLDQAFFEQVLIAHPSGVRLLASPKNLTEIDLVTPEGIRHAISLAKSTFPLVIVDLDHRFDNQQVQVLRQADLILVVMRSDFTSLKNTTKFLDHIDGLGVSSTRVRLIANRRGQPKEIPMAKVEEVLKTKVFHALPDDPWAANRANNNGIPVTLDSPKSKMARSLVKLTHIIQAHLKPQPNASQKTATTEGAATVVHLGTGTSGNGNGHEYRPKLANRPQSMEVSREIQR